MMTFAVVFLIAFPRLWDASSIAAEELIRAVDVDADHRLFARLTSARRAARRNRGGGGGGRIWGRWGRKDGI